MSFEDLLEETAKELEKENAQKWRKDPRWLAIKGVTKEDLQNGSNYIEKLSYPPWDKRSNQKEDRTKGDLVGFGKHANLTYQELKDKHSNYYSWALENVPRFTKKAKELGIN